MANSDTGSRSHEMDHDFLASFLAGEAQRRYLDSLAASELLCPAVDEDLDPPDLHAQHGSSDDTDGSPTCSNCCSQNRGCEVTAGGCDTKAQCQTHAPNCKTHEANCKKPGYEPPKHASWFDRP
jgi:hypothetical protein